MRTMSEERIKFYKEHYPPGTRICLDRMGDDYNPIPAGTNGTVIAVDDIGTVHCEFDNGRSLGVCPEVDRFHKISELTESQEPKMSM